MNLFELFQEPPKGYYSAQDDKSVRKLSDVRKTRLTLAQINKLRVLNDIKQLEQEEKKSKVKQQYSAPAGNEGSTF